MSVFLLFFVKSCVLTRAPLPQINGVPEADDVVFSSAPGPSHNAEDMYANEEQAQAGPLPWLRGGTVGGFTWAAAAGGSRNIRPLPNRSRARDDGMGGAGAAADGRMFNHDNDDDEEAEAERLNPPIFLGGRGLDALAGGVPPTLGEALRGFGGGGAFGAARPAGSGGGAGAAGGQGAGGLHPDLAHLRDLFANLFGDGVGDVFETFGAALGGRAGDYVFGDQGLSDVITGLMEQTQGQGSSAPPPASEESIEELERFSRFNAEKLGEHPCRFHCSCDCSLTQSLPLSSCSQSRMPYVPGRVCTLGSSSRQGQASRYGSHGRR